MANQASQQQTFIVGISGPSSSGKTTLARLLQRIFCGVQLKSEQLNTFIIHEDDFYYSDDQIPYTTLPSGKQIQDWDTVAAIDTSFLAQALSYVRMNGSLPPRLSSKEDQNEKGESGVEDSLVQELRDLVSSRLANAPSRTIAFMEGFLLYAPPSTATEKGEDNPLTKVQAQIHLPLFLPAPYTTVKARREGRAGYVTIGPGVDQPSPGEGNTVDKEDKEVDLEGEDDRPPQNFWVDPPGYVDDIVWPRYVGDHSWLIIPDHGEGEGGDGRDLVKRVGEGVNVRTDVGVCVAPGKGAVGMDVVVRWAVEEILRRYLGV
ncbi:Phosphoribulokinase/uridine kinase [Penicillium argentinense]|uniref:Phosphoribulokinase/uridine kinase n=1 Tax=Penicillium argentinense TaxID=1131581 RepID=A0A9W9FLT8_9EURO|nr:Phosphoribulokinase/uridine kinase [Penicillium argentinense]KAJ5102578.1 Phosphoribulokinase/uridine kinase [Penicillium argentinense]